MAVDPKEPEKGIFTATFSIPSSCTCSIDESQSGNVITTTTKRPVIERNTNQIQRRRDPPIERTKANNPIRMKTKFKIHDEFKTDWLNFDIGRRQSRTTTVTTTTTTSTTTSTTTTRFTTKYNPYYIPPNESSELFEYYDYYYDQASSFETEKYLGKSSTHI